MIILPTNSIEYNLHMIEKVQMPNKDKKIYGFYPCSKADYSQTFCSKEKSQTSFSPYATEIYHHKVGVEIKSNSAIVGNKNWDNKYGNKQFQGCNKAIVQHEIATFKKIDLTYEDNIVNIVEDIDCPGLYYSEITIRCRHDNKPYPLQRINLGRYNMVSLIGRSFMWNAPMYSLPKFNRNDFRNLELEFFSIKDKLNLNVKERCQLNTINVEEGGELNIKAKGIDIYGECNGNINLEGSFHIDLKGSGPIINNCKTSTISMCGGSGEIKNLIKCGYLHRGSKSDTWGVLYIHNTGIKYMKYSVPKGNLIVVGERPTPKRILIFGNLENDLHLFADAPIIILHNDQIHLVEGGNYIVLPKGGKVYEEYTASKLANDLIHEEQKGLSVSINECLNILRSKIEKGEIK